MPESDDIADAMTFRDLQINRFAEFERRKVFALLAAIQEDIEAQLIKIDPAGPARGAFKQKRLENLLVTVNKALNDGYRGIASEQTSSLKNLAEVEASRTVAIVNDAVGVDLLSAVPSSNTLRALVDDAIIEGATVKDWWKRQSVRTRELFADQIRLGISEGESTNDLLRRVRGTRERRFTDGIQGITRRNAERIVRTSVNSVSNAAREATYKENADVIRGVQAVVTLDTRTSDICKARAGGAWNPVTGRPLKESTVRSRYPGPPPWHWRCRTTLISVPKGSPPADDLGFEGWLSKQTEARQREALGPGRLELWKAGKISMTDLIDQRGRPKTLEQLA